MKQQTGRVAETHPEMVLQLVVDVLLPAADLLQCAGDLVIQLVEVRPCVLQRRLYPVLVLVHLLRVHPPVLEYTTQPIISWPIVTHQKMCQQ